MDLDAWDWLEPGGGIPRSPADRRRRALFVARCIEYGGPLPPGIQISTLIPCQRRPGGSACRGLLEIDKEEEGRLRARCPECGHLAVRVRGWESTPWAGGPIPVHVPPHRELTAAEGGAERAAEGGAADGAQAPAGRASLVAEEGRGGGVATSIPDAVDRRLESVLREMQSSLDAATVRRHIALARTPSKVVELVAGSGAVPDEAALETLCDALIDAWNHTPRSELGGRTPAQMSRAMAMPADASRMGATAQMAATAATGAPCLCGSGAPAAQCCAPQFH